MAMTCCLSQTLHYKPSNALKIRLSSKVDETKLNITRIQAMKRCLRCNTLYLDKDNSPTACSFHGHTTGEKGLYALAPPHQSIDGEWSDRSGVIVYKWNDKNNRPDTGSLEVSIGRKDGVAVVSMMKMLHLVDGGGMFHMTMASLCINPKIVLLAKFRSISNN